MPYHPDLTPIDFFEGVSCVAIGFLDAAHDYTRGEVPLEFLKKLVAFAANPPTPFVEAGVHHCNLCRYSRGPGQFHYAGLTIDPIGRDYIIIPADQSLFVAPRLTLHYIDAHQYAPPSDFVESVLTSPPLASNDYRRLLVRSGFARYLKRARLQHAHPAHR